MKQIVFALTLILINIFPNFLKAQNKTQIDQLLEKFEYCSYRMENWIKILEALKNYEGQIKEYNIRLWNEYSTLTLKGLTKDIYYIDSLGAKLESLSNYFSYPNQIRNYNVIIDTLNYFKNKITQLLPEKNYYSAENVKFDINWNNNPSRKIYSLILPGLFDGIKKDSYSTFLFSILPEGSVGFIIPLDNNNPELIESGIYALKQWRFEQISAFKPQVEQTATILFKYD